MKNIYPGHQRTWADGTPVRSYMRPLTSDAGFTFFARIMNMTPPRFKYHWQALQLSGQGVMPRTLSSAEDVASHLAAERGAVCYMSEAEAKAAGGRVKVLAITQ